MKGIIFDLDGTLANTAFIHKDAWEIALSELGIKTEVKIETLLGRKTAEIAKILSKDRWEDLMRIKNEVYLSLVREKAKSTECAKELVELGRKLGYKIAIVTSSNSVSAKEVLQTIKIFPDLLVTSDEVNNGKPDPEGVNIAVKKLSLDPSKSIGVGDTEVDVIAFKRANLGKIFLVKSEVPVNEENVRRMGGILVSSLCELFNQIN